MTFNFNGTVSDILARSDIKLYFTQVRLISMWPQLKCSKVLYSKHENVCRILGTSYNRTILGFHVALSLIPKLFCDIENCIENADFQKMMEDVYNASTDESDMTDSEGDEGEDLVLDRLAISKEQAAIQQPLKRKLSIFWPRLLKRPAFLSP